MIKSSAREPAASGAPALWPRLCRSAAAITLLSAVSASAQTASAPAARVDAAHAAWRKLSQSEVNCVDKALRARDSQIWQLIQRGIGPGDKSVAGVRAGCGARIKTAAATTAQNAASARAAAQAPNRETSREFSREYWSFNGSTLNMVADGHFRKFFYFRLGPEAEAAGAQPGDLFLDGKVSGERIVGTVYSHDGRCGRVPYRVDGTIRESNRRLELQGQKPRIDGNCTVAGTVLDALTFRAVDAATAVAAAPPAAKPAAAKPAATSPTVAKPAIEKAAAVMAAADHSAIAKAEADDAAEFKTAPDKPQTERPAASRPASVKVVIAATSETKVAANEAVAEKASAEAAVEIARAEAARAQALADQARNDAERAVAEAIASAASAQSKIAFLYGLASGPVLLGAGAIALWLLRRRRHASPEPSAA